jgi:Fic family protein
MKIPERPPDPYALFGALDPARMPAVLTAMSGAMTVDAYHHWADLRYRKPPGDLNHDEWWCALKFGRVPLFKDVPLVDTHGRPFRFCVPDLAQRMLHQIDQALSGHIAVSDVVTNPSTRDRYVVSSLIEEAITSSQLEGASTTRKIAKDMIRSGRPPTTKSERMILNNFVAMQRAVEIRDQRLTPELVLELHRLVSNGTLSSVMAEGRMQEPSDERVHVWSVDGRLLHSPPRAEELPERLRRMCEFANGSGDQGFVHPVIRALILHFWLAYDHPFEDGNGRTTRAVFYWSMLAQDYWLAEFLAISSILRKAPAKYARSFLLTETDDNDLTYFLLYNLGVILRAIDQLHAYLQRKISEIRDAETFIRDSAFLNHRQLALLSHAMRHPGMVYTIQSHRLSHRVVYETARSDLLELERIGVLTRLHIGRAFAFEAVADVQERLRAASS